jgi:hypothetical protein
VIKKMQEKENDKQIKAAKLAREAKSKSPAEKKEDPDEDGKGGDKGPSLSSAHKKLSVLFVRSSTRGIAKYSDKYEFVDEFGQKGINFSNHYGKVSAASPCSDDSTDVPDDEEYLVEWDKWSEVEQGHGPKASWEGKFWDTKSGVFVPGGSASPSIQGKSTGGGKYNPKKRASHDEDTDCIFEVPTMPCMIFDNNHRVKIPDSQHAGKLFNATVSRPVGRAEIESNPDAKAAMLKEWKRLRDQGVFDFTMVREYTTMLSKKPKETRKRYTRPGSTGFVWKRITNFPMMTLEGNLREEAFSSATRLRIKIGKRRSFRT